MLRNVGLVLAIATMALAGWLLGMPASLTVYAQQPVPGPSDGSVGVEGRITSPPPTQAATIISPANGQSFNTIPVTVTGSCPANSLIKIFSNDIFIGSATCANGSYSLQVSLFSGRNDLVARVFDSLDQAGPDSATITINYTDPQFATFGSQVLLTSQYARRAADPSSTLTWPIILSSGVGPYAVSVDWGDGTPIELKSQPFAGIIDLNHAFKNPGTYKVIFKVVDSNGSSAFLQVIAVVNGSGGADYSNAAPKNETVITKTEVMWQPAVGLLLLIPFCFWLGRRFELASLRKRIEREYR